MHNFCEDLLVKVAAYRAPLGACRSMEMLALIRAQVDRCESLGVEIVCCPERVLGGLADYSSRPTGIAIDVEGGQLNTVLAPLASNAVTTILGFTEIDRSGDLYNSAAARSGPGSRGDRCHGSQSYLAALAFLRARRKRSRQHESIS